ncbi:MAG: hypothetical protein NT145_07760 [Elusimicrobia bacterium]|nr:hypothetical protein [Elusimicrobiota bacterium]
MQKYLLILIFVIAALFIDRYIYAGVINPDISVIGQVNTISTDDKSSENSGKAVTNIGETEIMFESYLNPYARGTFVFAICPVHGLETEEAFISIFKGLPDGLAVKAGKYRIGFGKLNPVHPHAYPFMEAPEVMKEMLPGDESFNDTGIDLSYLTPVYGSWALNATVGTLNGKSFHPDDTKADSAWIGRLSNSFLINDYAPAEFGASATQGTNDTLWNAKTSVYGGDFKVKFKSLTQNTLTVQGEYFYNNSDVVIDTTTGNYNTIGRNGFYVFTDYAFNQRYNAGVIYNQYQRTSNKEMTDRSVKLFTGYTLLEETTLFRLSYEKFFPDGEEPVNTYMFQILFSMGPHKAHQF